MNFGVGDTAVRTDDGVIGPSGKRIRLFSLTLRSGGTASVLALHNGTGTGGTMYFQGTGAISTGVTFVFGQCGRLFPAGCYADVDANVASVIADYVVEA